MQRMFHARDTEYWMSGILRCVEAARWMAGRGGHKKPGVEHERRVPVQVMCL
jgi:hypothetical protein